MHNYRLKIPPPDTIFTNRHHLHTTVGYITILHHPTPHYKHLTNKASDTILHHLHHLTTDDYIGHIYHSSDPGAVAKNATIGSVAYRLGLMNGKEFHS
jgi:hypothetical protein